MAAYRRQRLVQHTQMPSTRWQPFCVRGWPPQVAERASCRPRRQQWGRRRLQCCRCGTLLWRQCRSWDRRLRWVRIGWVRVESLEQKGGMQRDGGRRGKSTRSADGTRGELLGWIVRRQKRVRADARAGAAVACLLGWSLAVICLSYALMQAGRRGMRGGSGRGRCLLGRANEFVDKE